MNETESVPPASLPEVYAAYRRIAPVPQPGAQGSTWDMARFLAVEAQARLTAETAEATAPGAEAAMCAQFAALHLLQWIRRAYPEAAARLVNEITGVWADGTAFAEWLHDHSANLGVDIARVRWLAEAEAALKTADASAPDPRFSVAMGVLQRIDRTKGSVVDTAALWKIAADAISEINSHHAFTAAAQEPQADQADDTTRGN